MLKTCQAMGRVRQGVGYASMTRGRRIGVASAMRCRIGDASAMRSVGAGSVALVVWRSEEMMLKSRQAMGPVRQGVWRCVSVASVTHRRRVGNISATQWHRVGDAFGRLRRYVCVASARDVSRWLDDESLLVGRC